MNIDGSKKSSLYFLEILQYPFRKRVLVHGLTLFFLMAKKAQLYKEQYGEYI